MVPVYSYVLKNLFSRVKFYSIQAQNLQKIGVEQLMHYLMRTKKEDQNEV